MTCVCIVTDALSFASYPCSTSMNLLLVLRVNLPRNGLGFHIPSSCRLMTWSLHQRRSRLFNASECFCLHQLDAWRPFSLTKNIAQSDSGVKRDEWGFFQWCHHGVRQLPSITWFNPWWLHCDNTNKQTNKQIVTFCVHSKTIWTKRKYLAPNTAYSRRG